MSACEIILAGSVEDAAGYYCGRTAREKCSDCGSELCELHAESCDFCDQIFCSSCCFFDLQQPHPKRGVPNFNDIFKNRSA